MLCSVAGGWAHAASVDTRCLLVRCCWWTDAVAGNSLRLHDRVRRGPTARQEQDIFQRKQCTSSTLTAACHIDTDSLKHAWCHPPPRNAVHVAAVTRPHHTCLYDSTRCRHCNVNAHTRAADQALIKGLCAHHGSREEMCTTDSVMEQSCRCQWRIVDQRTRQDIIALLYIGCRNNSQGDARREAGRGLDDSTCTPHTNMQEVISPYHALIQHVYV